MLEKLFAPYVGLGEFIMRLAVGITFIAHGRSKLKDPASFAGFLRQIHVPAPLVRGRNFAREFMFLNPRRARNANSRGEATASGVGTQRPPARC
jgi:hypothetical protein